MNPEIAKVIVGGLVSLATLIFVRKHKIKKTRRKQKELDTRELETSKKDTTQYVNQDID